MFRFYRIDGVGDDALMTDIAQPPGTDCSASRKFNFLELLLVFPGARGESTSAVQEKVLKSSEP